MRDLGGGQTRWLSVQLMAAWFRAWHLRQPPAGRCNTRFARLVWFRRDIAPTLQKFGDGLLVREGEGRLSDGYSINN
jgi:hypothetical protein